MAKGLTRIVGPAAYLATRELALLLVGGALCSVLMAAWTVKRGTTPLLRTAIRGGGHYPECLHPDIINMVR